MKSISTIISCLLLLALTACGHAENPQNEQLYHYVADRPIICQKGADCDKKWARAVEWVREHNVVYTKDGRKIELSLSKLTRSVIQTHESNVEETRFRILRIPREDGTFSIDYTSSCGLSNDCYLHKGRPLKMSFVSALIGLPPGVTQTSPNSYNVAPGVLAPVNKH